MIHASPCDFYLKYLCTHPDNYTDSSIRNLIKLEQLDFLGMEHLQRLRASCTPPVPFYPEDLRHRESQRFLTKERIFQLYHPDDDTVVAIKLLDHPQGKELVESVLAAGGEPSWACAILKRVQFKATPRAIDLYRHYYFNTKLLNSTELRAVLHMRSTLEVDGSDGDARSYRHSYSKVSKGSVFSTVSATPISPFSHALNMMRLGLMPENVDLSRVASAARMASVIRCLENSMMGYAEKARDFALTGKILTELMESVGDVSGDLQRSLMSLSLDTDSAEIPSIKKLTGGDHTTDLIPELMQQQEIEVEAEHAEAEQRT